MTPTLPVLNPILQKSEVGEKWHENNMQPSFSLSVGLQFIKNMRKKRYGKCEKTFPLYSLIIIEIRGVTDRVV